MDAAAAVEAHFRDLLMPRNHGLIAVAALVSKTNDICRPPRRVDTKGFLVCLSTEPFLEINFENGAIILHVSYPRSLAVWCVQKKGWVQGFGTFQAFSKNPKKRAAEVNRLGTSRIGDGRTIQFDLCDPESLRRAEFYVQTTITRIKYMVTKSNWLGTRPKPDLEFDDLVDLATRDYTQKVIAPTRKKK